MCTVLPPADNPTAVNKYIYHIISSTRLPISALWFAFVYQRNILTLGMWHRCRLRLKCDGTCAETRFLLSAKRKSPFKSAGESFQSTTGSRGVRISGSNAGYTMFRGSVKSTGYPLHSPASPSLSFPCVTVCHHIIMWPVHDTSFLVHTVVNRSLYGRPTYCGSNSCSGKDFYLFSKASRVILGLNKPPVQFVQGATSPSEKRPRREPDHLPPSSVVVKNAWSYTSTPPTRVHVVQRDDNLNPYYCISSTVDSISTQAE